jgi:hypothetical protein
MERRRVLFSSLLVRVPVRTPFQNHWQEKVVEKDLIYNLPMVVAREGCNRFGVRQRQAKSLPEVIQKCDDVCLGP